MNYSLSQLSEQVTTARAHMHAIEIVGGNTKRFYGNPIQGRDQVTRIEMSALSGIISYEPSELVLTAWAGTPLSEIESTLAGRGQMLAFDPPRFGDQSTIGGVVASGLSGPMSYGYGALRHFVLGAHLLDAQGRILKFGGEVMKNVAGYDVSRLLAGSMGMFGVIVQVSIKVMPVPKQDLTLAFEANERDALAQCAGLRAKAMPIKAAAYLPSAAGAHEGMLAIRLCGADSAVRQATGVLGGEVLAADAAKDWWQSFRDQRAGFFDERPLWRIAVRAQTPRLDLGPSAFDLGGELRWLASGKDSEQMRQVAADAGGHATLFRARADDVPADGVFQPMAPTARAIVQRLKREFDPMSIFNPGRLVAGI